MRSAALLATVAALSLALAGSCADEDVVPEQLEALTLSLTAGGSGGASSATLEASGGATVTGQGRDFHVDVGAGALAFDLHLPGMSELSLLDGREVTVAVTRETAAYVEQLTVTIDDASGIAFMASNVPGASSTIGWGELVAEEEVDGVVWGYTRVAVQHDAGSATPLPGDVVDATIDGAAWRIVPHAAHRVEDASGQESDCILPADVLGFEMLRVDEPVVPGRVDRPVELPMVRATSCG
jgi:hypothetical protein